MEEIKGNNLFEKLFKFLARYYNLQSDDVNKLVTLSLIYFCIIIANTFGMNAVTSIFISTEGSQSLPLMYVLTSIVVFFSIVGYSIFIDRLDKRKLLWTTTVLFGVLILISRVALMFHFKWLNQVLYIGTETIRLVLFTQFWALANDICDLRQAKRLFPLVIGSGLLGGIAAGFLCGVIAEYIHTENLFILWSLPLFAIFFVSKRLKTSTSTDKEKESITTISTMVNDLVGGAGYVLSSSYLRAIGISFFLYALAVYFLDFQYNRIVAGSFQEDRLTAFYGYYSGVFYLFTFMIQMFAVNKILSRFGVGNVLLIFPSIVLSGFSSLIVYLQLGSAIYAKLTRDVVGNSLVDTAYPLLFNPVERKMRGRTISFIEGVVIPLGIATAGGTLIFFKDLNPQILCIIGLVLTGIWLLMSLNLRKEYVRTLLATLRDTSFDVRYLTIKAIDDMKTDQAEKVLVKALREPNDDLRIFAIEMIDKLKLSNTIPDLVEILETEDNSKIRATVIETLGSFSSHNIYEVLIKYTSDKDDRVRANAIESIGKIGIKDGRDALLGKLDDPVTRVKINACIALHKLGDDRGLESLQNMLKSQNPELRSSAAYAAGQMVHENKVILGFALNDTAPKVRLSALRGLPQDSSDIVIDYLGKSLDDPAPMVNRYARERLIRTGGEHAFELLSSRLRLSNIKSILTAIEGLGAMHDPRAKKLLVKYIDHANDRLREAVIEAYDLIETREERVMFINCLKRETASVYYNIAIIHKLLPLVKKVPIVQILIDALNDKNLRLKKLIFKIIGLLEGFHHGDKFLRWRDSDTRRRAYVLEFLEETGEQYISQYTLPILEETEISTLYNLSNVLFAQESIDLVKCFSKLAADSEEWVRACAAYVLQSINETTYTETIINMLDDESKLVRQNAEKALELLEKKAPGVVNKIRWAEIMLKRYKNA